MTVSGSTTSRLEAIGRAVWATGRDYDGEVPETALSRGVAVLTGAVIAWEVEDEVRVPIGGDVTNVSMPRVVRIERWTDASGPAVTVWVDSSDGTPRPRRALVEWPPPAVMDKLGYNDLVELGAAQVTRYLRRTVGERTFDPPVGVLMAIPDAVSAVRRARRVRIDDETLALTVEAYRSTTGAGRVVAVMNALGRSESQARRYIARAQEIGLLERERAPRKTATKPKG